MHQGKKIITGVAEGESDHIGTDAARIIGIAGRIVAALIAGICGEIAQGTLQNVRLIIDTIAVAIAGAVKGLNGFCIAIGQAMKSALCGMEGGAFGMCQQLYGKRPRKKNDKEERKEKFSGGRPGIFRTVMRSFGMTLRRGTDNGEGFAMRFIGAFFRCFRWNDPTSL